VDSDPLEVGAERLRGGPLVAAQRDLVDADGVVPRERAAARGNGPDPAEAAWVFDTERQGLL
jgi:hypothetical protein